MVRSRVLVGGFLRGFWRAAALGLVVLVIVPACAGRSISGDDEGGEGGDGLTIPSDDDEGDDAGFSGNGGSSGGPQGGIGAVGNAGTTASGGSFPSGGTSPSGGAFPMGGTSPSGGAIPTGGAIASGGTFPTGGVGGMPCAGSASDAIAGSSGMTPPVNTDPQCRGVLNNAVCPVAGKMCPNLACGLADSGRRQCVCSTNWSCSFCDFSGSRFATRPCNIEACPSGIADEVACSSEGTVCGPEVTGEFCACYFSPTDGLIWDCDDAPSSWAL